MRKYCAMNWFRCNGTYFLNSNRLQMLDHVVVTLHHFIADSQFTESNNYSINNFLPNFVPLSIFDSSISIILGIPIDEHHAVVSQGTIVFANGLLTTVILLLLLVLLLVAQQF